MNKVKAVSIDYDTNFPTKQGTNNTYMHIAHSPSLDQKVERKNTSFYLYKLYAIERIGVHFAINKTIFAQPKFKLNLRRS